MGTIPKYNVGDRVMVVPFSECFGYDVPGKGTVMHWEKTVNGSIIYSIEFDEFVKGHECGGHCKRGYGFWHLEDEITLCESSLQSPTVGDTSLLFGG